MTGTLEADLDALLKVLIALALAATLGWERERHRRPAGLRTHMLTALAATLLTCLGPRLVAWMGEAAPGLRFDPLRVIEAVLTGIAFLGAGTILVGKRREHVKGLTTATSLLATAAIGIAVGVGSYALAIGSTVLVLVVLALLGRLSDRLVPARSDRGDASSLDASRSERRV
ncbi:MAG: MgtC/SapB family protein [Sandaracinaceae bacterium]